MPALTAPSLLPLLVAALVEAPKAPDAEARASLIQLDPRSAVVALLSEDDARLLVLLCYDAHQQPDDLPTRIAEALQHERPEVLAGSDAELEVLVLGGRGELPSWSPPTVYVPLARRLTLHQLPLPEAAALSIGDLRLLGPAETVAHRRLQEALARLAERDAPVAPLAPPQAQALERSGEALLGEAGAFSLRGQGRTPIALSAAIITVLTILLVLEALWGGSDNTQTLFRMGANHGVHVARGEWWRLLSSGLLHGGAKHLFGNASCLLILMPFAVGLLGISRTLVLLIASTLGAEALSAWARPTSLGLGASGGIFGVMASLVTVGLRPGRVVPRLSRSSVLGPAGFFLFINGCTSFQAGVGGMAHLGGALCGALLAGSGLLTVGLSADGRATPGSRWTYRALALCALALCALCLRQAWQAGEPWRLREPTLREVALPASPVTLQVTADLGPPRVSPSGRHFTFGDGLRDALLVSLIARPLEPPDPSAPPVSLESLRAEHRQPGEGLTYARPPELVTLPSGPALFLDQRRGPVALPRWLMLLGAPGTAEPYLVDLQLSLAPGAPPAYPALAPRIAASVHLARTP